MQRFQWFIQWRENGQERALDLPTGEESYRMAGAIADRLHVHVSVHPPMSGMTMQPSISVALERARNEVKAL